MGATFTLFLQLKQRKIGRRKTLFLRSEATENSQFFSSLPSIDCNSFIVLFVSHIYASLSHFAVNAKMQETILHIVVAAKKKRKKKKKQKLRTKIADLGRKSFGRQKGFERFEVVIYLNCSSNFASYIWKFTDVKLR